MKKVTALLSLLVLIVGCSGGGNVSSNQHHGSTNSGIISVADASVIPSSVTVSSIRSAYGDGVRISVKAQVSQKASPPHTLKILDINRKPQGR